MPTALIYSIEPDRIVVVTDTLALFAGDRSPSHFVTKAYPIPHLDALIAVTGDLELGVQAFAAAQTGLVARDASVLARHFQPVLSELWRKRREDLDEDLESSATIYLYGFDGTAGRFFAWVFRSEAGFDCERQESGLAVKPGTSEIPESDGQIDFVELVTRLKAEDDRRPMNDRVGIGGDVIAWVLTEGECRSVRLHRFEDFDEVWEQMLVSHRMLGGPR